MRLTAARSIGLGVFLDVFLGVFLDVFLGALSPTGLGTAAAQGLDVQASELYDDATPLDGARVTGWYVAPTSGLTRVGGGVGYVVGVRAAVMLEHRVGIGFAGNALGTRQMRLGSEGRRDVGGYGGIYLQYDFFNGARIHGSADTTIGIGTWCSAGDDAGRCAGRDFVLVEPALNAAVDVAPGVRLAMGLGYRGAKAAQGASASGLSGPVARASLVFGAF